MEIRLFISTKERVLSQENQTSSKDGSISTKVVDSLESFQRIVSSKTSNAPGMTKIKDSQMKLECLWQLEGFLGDLGIKNCSDIYSKLKQYYKIRI